MHTRLNSIICGQICVYAEGKLKNNVLLHVSQYILNDKKILMNISPGKEKDIFAALYFQKKTYVKN